MTTLNRTTPKRKRSIGGIQLGIDTPLLLATIFLILFGLVMVFSASWEISYFEYEGSHTRMFERQLMFMVLWRLGRVVFAIILMDRIVHLF